MHMISRTFHCGRLLAGLAATLLETACGSGGGDPSLGAQPLTQAPSGPGGADYRYAQSVMTAETEGHAGYRLFEPRTGEGASRPTACR